MQNTALVDLINSTLAELKAEAVVTLDVSSLTTITDHMVICSGRSDRHVKAIAQRLIEEMKQHGCQPAGVVGLQAGQWVLVDLVDVVVHIMLPEVRDFYDLEKLWGSGNASGAVSA